MNDVLLINKINPSKTELQKRHITFILGDMHLEEVHHKIYEIVKGMDFVETEELTLKYNGISVDLKIPQIPEFIKVLTQEGLKLYGAYELYGE